MSTSYVVSLIFSLNNSTSSISNNRPCSFCGSNKYSIVKKVQQSTYSQLLCSEEVERTISFKKGRKTSAVAGKETTTSYNIEVVGPTDRRRRHLMNNAWRIWLYYVLVYFQLQQSNSSSSIFTHRPAKAEMLSYHKTSFKLLRVGTTCRKAKAT